MATETETMQGVCEEHGSVEGTRELPKVTFPWVVNAVRRSMAAKKTPFRCPQCGRPLEVR